MPLNADQFWSIPLNADQCRIKASVKHWWRQQCIANNLIFTTRHGQVLPLVDFLELLMTNVNQYRSILTDTNADRYRSMPDQFCLIRHWSSLITIERYWSELMGIEIFKMHSSHRLSIYWFNLIIYIQETSLAGKGRHWPIRPAALLPASASPRLLC